MLRYRVCPRLGPPDRTCMARRSANASRAAFSSGNQPPRKPVRTPVESSVKTAVKNRSDAPYLVALDARGARNVDPFAHLSKLRLLPRLGQRRRGHSAPVRLHVILLAPTLPGGLPSQAARRRLRGPRARLPALRWRAGPGRRGQRATGGPAPRPRRGDGAPPRSLALDVRRLRG